MSSYLSAVGFCFDEVNYYDDLIETFSFLMSQSAREISVGNSTYLVLYVDDVEFWLPVGEDRTIDPTLLKLHLNTHRWDDVTNPSWRFKTCRDMYGTAFLHRVNDGCPIAVTVPNALLAPEFCSEKVYKAQIACFAESIEIFRTEESFSKVHEDTSPQSFISIDEFEEFSSGKKGLPRAWLSGYVKAVNRRTNSYTKKDYYHLLVASVGGVFDVFVDADGTDKIQVGDIVSVIVCLSGKIRVRYQGDDFATLRRLKNVNEKLQTLDDLYKVLRKSWCKQTAYPSCQFDWQECDPSLGQCAITAMLVHDMFGGSIHRIRNKGGGTHYFNRIDGKYIDLTREQFDLYDIPVQYEPNEKIERRYCGKNADTKSRYDMLIKKVLENVK